MTRMGWELSLTPDTERRKSQGYTARQEASCLRGVWMGPLPDERRGKGSSGPGDGTLPS